MNTNRTYLFTFLLAISCTLSAQVKAPKWAEKAKQAVVRIITYDKEDKAMKEGNAFLIDESGVALSNLSLFKGAQSAKAIDWEGTEMPVEVILGANDLYDVIKFRITPSKKKNPYLKLVSKKPQIGEEAVLLGYSPEKKADFVIGSVEQIAPLGGDSYYTLSMPLADNQVSAPLLNAQGEVFGLAQQSVSEPSGKAYAMAASFGKNLALTALSLTDKQLNAIGIPKDLPESQEQAVAMLYMAASLPDQARYYHLLNRFIARYPASEEGYRLRAAYYTLHFEQADSLKLAESDMEATLKYAKEKDYAHYYNSQCILSYAVRHDSATYKDWSLQKSLDEVQKAIEIRPQPIYFHHEANLYSLMKNYEKAYEAYEKVNQSNIASPASFYAASKIKRILNDTTGISLALLDSCIARFSKPYTAEAAPYLFERAEIRVQAGRDAEAVEDYDAYEQCAPSKPNAYFYYRREQAAMRAGNQEKALEDIQKALRLLPGDPALLEEHGSILVTLLRYKEALKYLDAALEKDANRSYAYRLKGYALIQENRKEEAREALIRGKALGDEISAQLLAKYFKE